MDRYIGERFIGKCRVIAGFDGRECSNCKHWQFAYRNSGEKFGFCQHPLRKLSVTLTMGIELCAAHSSEMSRQGKVVLNRQYGAFGDPLNNRDGEPA